MQGPAPTVNWSRSATSATSELAPSGIRCCDASTRHSPASSTASVRAQARASRTGSSSGPASAGSVTSAKAEAKRSAMVTPHRPPLRRRPLGQTEPARDHGGVEPRVLPYGDRALLVQVADLASVAAVRTALEGAPLPGQRDLVPAASTVLVVLDRAPTDLDVAALRRLPLTAPADGAAAHEVELPVVFDGADLADVAELTGRGVGEVIRLLTITE